MFHKICKRATFKEKTQFSLGIFVPAHICEDPLTLTENMVHIRSHTTRISQGQCFTKPQIDKITILYILRHRPQISRPVVLGMIGNTKIFAQKNEFTNAIEDEFMNTIPGGIDEDSSRSIKHIECSHLLPWSVANDIASRVDSKDRPDREVLRNERRTIERIEDHRIRSMRGELDHLFPFFGDKRCNDLTLTQKLMNDPVTEYIKRKLLFPKLIFALGKSRIGRLDRIADVPRRTRDIHDKMSESVRNFRRVKKMMVE